MIFIKNKETALRNWHCWLLTMLLLCCTISSEGQDLKSKFRSLESWSIEPSLHIGRIIKHSPELLFDVKGLTKAGEIYINFQTYGKKEWEQFQRFPKLGVSFFYNDLGEAAIFGEALTIMPNISIVAFQRKKFKLDFRFGTGLAYLTKTYDFFDNPSFNAIGSHWNGSVLFEFSSQVKLNDSWKIKGGTSFLHYSNGSSHLPNFGINVASIVLGLHYTPYAVPQEEYIRHDLSKKSTTRWGVQAWGTLGFKERGISGGPSQPIYAGSVGAMYYLNKVNRLSAGLEYEYNKSVYDFGKHVFAFNSESEAKWRSSRLQFFVADEFLFGNWGITLLLGAYVGDSFYLLPFPIYNKLITRYYIPIKGRLKLNVGVYLKSHISIAEYLGLGTGLSF